MPKKTQVRVSTTAVGTNAQLALAFGDPSAEHPKPGRKTLPKAFTMGIHDSKRLGGSELARFKILMPTSHRHRSMQVPTDAQLQLSFEFNLYSQPPVQVRRCSPTSSNTADMEHSEQAARCAADDLAHFQRLLQSWTLAGVIA